MNALYKVSYIKITYESKKHIRMIYLVQRLLECYTNSVLLRPKSVIVHRVSLIKSPFDTHESIVNSLGRNPAQPNRQ